MERICRNCNWWLANHTVERQPAPDGLSECCVDSPVRMFFNSTGVVHSVYSVATPPACSCSEWEPAPPIPSALYVVEGEVVEYNLDLPNRLHSYPTPAFADVKTEDEKKWNLGQVMLQEIGEGRRVKVTIEVLE